MTGVLYILLIAVNAASVFVLSLYTIRRIVYGVAALKAKVPEQLPLADPLPSLLVMVPCKNEEAVVSGVLHALAGQDYPKEKLQVVFINDGSTDDTGRILDAFAKQQENFHVLHRSGADVIPGKAASLNKAALLYEGEILCVFDADSIPEKSALKTAMAHFTAEDVAAVQGRMSARNMDDSMVAYYAGVEGLVHQMVTMRSSSSVGGTVALMGTNMYIRRSAYEQAGSFAVNKFLEDTDLTLALPADAGKIVFDPEVRCSIEAPVTMDTYRLQHVQWQRGFSQSLKSRGGDVLRDSGRSIWQKSDALLFSMGYLDRVFLALGLLVTIVNVFWQKYFFPWWLWAVILVSPLVQVALCFKAMQAPLRYYFKLPILFLLFPFDVANVFQAVWQQFRKHPVDRKRTPRAVEHAMGHLQDEAEEKNEPAPIEQGKLLAVVLGYNDRQHLAGCLGSIVNGPLRPCDVIYVDNASTDDSALFVRQRFPGVRVIETGSNLGYAGGVNAGFRFAMEAGAKSILVLNTDVTLQPGAVKALHDELSRDENVAAVGGLALSMTSPGKIDGGYGMINYRQVLSRLVFENQPVEKVKNNITAKDVDYPYGCMWLVRAKALEQVGLFDEEFFCYHEELEWCYRARQAGYRCRFTPMAVCYHARQRGLPEGELFKRRMLARNTVLFLKKHGRLDKWLRFFLFVLLVMPVRALRDTQSGHPRYTLEQLRGYFHGFRKRAEN